jgi:hypothetical protein
VPNLTDRAQRRELRLPVNLSGRDGRGTPFAERGQTVNVSAGGVCFEAVRRVPIGARVDLRIQVPPALRHRFGGRAVYAVQAIVCRLEAIEGGATYRIGARFVGELDA